MDDGGPTASIIFFIVLLLIDIFFYGFKAAFESLSESEIERRAEEDKDKKSVRLKKIIDNPAKYKNTVWLITTLSGLVIGALYMELLLRYKPDVITAVLSALLVLYITMTLGVLFPKKLGAKKSEKWAYAGVSIVCFFATVLSPVTWIMWFTTKGLLRLFGINGNTEECDVTEEEIISMVNEGHEQGVIQASEAEMISNIFELGDKEAQDIMTHRRSIVAVDGAASLRDVMRFMLEEKYSRYPVYEENIDRIVGILHLKDVMRFHTDNAMVDQPLSEQKELLREPYFVPQTKNIDELFREMQAEKLQMVIVVDEYGQTDGIVAMEDILEEIVGNILDEYDEDDEFIEEKGNDEYVVEGQTRLDELEERFSISFEEEECDTVNGFLISRLDKIPEPDEQFDVDYKGYNFKILSVENKMIQSVLVTKLPEDVAEDAGEAKEEAQ